MRRKIVSLLLVLAMVLCLMPTALASEKGSFAAGENKVLTLGGKAAGTFNIAGDETKGFTLLNKRGKYVALEDGWITESRSAFTWSYDGGLYAQSYVENGGHHWWRWWAPRSYRAVSLYLAADENGLTTSSAKVTAITAEAETEAQLKNAVTNVTVTESRTGGYSGWFFWLWSRPEYCYTIKTQAEGVTVAKVEHGDSLEALTQGSSFTSHKKLSEFVIQITDSKGVETQWQYKDRQVTLMGNVEEEEEEEVLDNNPYLTFSSDGEFSLGTSSKAWTTVNAESKLYYNVGNPTSANDWKEWDGTAQTASLSGSKYKIYLRGKMVGTMALSGSSSTNCTKLSLTGTSVDCSGNIMALLDYENPSTVAMGEHAFDSLFRECQSLVSAPSLPAKALSKYCYRYMFRGTSLAKAPELPATDLTGCDRCYEGMFYECKSLTEAPELSALNLSIFCYCSMFANCVELSQAPALPVKTLTNGCYSAMFMGCKKLSEAPVLSATTLVFSCYEQMFQGCIALTEAPVLSASTLDSACYCRMFKDCTSLTKTPVLPAETLANNCYEEMFSGCSSLKITKMASDEVSAGLTKIFTCPSTSGYNKPVTDMFSGCCSDAGYFTGSATDGKTYYYGEAEP